jgi:hypothetical protein
MINEVFMQKRQWQQFQKFRQFWQFRRIIYFLVSFSAVIILGMGLSPAQAQINQATVTEVLDGNQVFIQGRQARINSTAGAGQQVSTGSSRAGLRFNNGAAGRLRSNTSLVIGQCIQVQQGGIIASGPTNACLGSIRVATRGTTFLTELGTDDVYAMKVLEGSVGLVPIENLSSPVPEIFVNQGQKVSITKDGRISNPELITAVEAQEIVNSDYFNGFAQPLPGISNLRRSLQEQYPNISLPPSLRSTPVRGLW